MYEILYYKTPSGKVVYKEWLRKLQDRQAKAAIPNRLDRVSSGNFGDCKFCRAGVWELRINIGSGYRLYYAKMDHKIIMLLCAGNKRTQDKDIDRACGYWKEFQNR